MCDVCGNYDPSVKKSFRQKVCKAGVDLVKTSSLRNHKNKQMKS